MIKEDPGFRIMADYINKSRIVVSYEHFDDKTEDILTYIACIISPFKESDFDSTDREIKEGSDADIIVKELIDAISTRSLEETIKKLLLEHNQYEILQHLDF